MEAGAPSLAAVRGRMTEKEENSKTAVSFETAV